MSSISKQDYEWTQLKNVQLDRNNYLIGDNQVLLIFSMISVHDRNYFDENDSS